MEKKEVIIGHPITIAELTLIPVIEVSLHYWHPGGGVSFFGVKQPVSIAVVSPSARKAFRLSGEEVPLDQLIMEAPGLRETLETV